MNTKIQAILAKYERASLGELMMALQSERHDAGMVAVTCECRNHIGPITAMLSGCATQWVCGARSIVGPQAECCLFKWPVADTLSAPERPLFERSEIERQREQNTAPPVIQEPAPLSPIDAAIENCNIDREAMSEMQFAQLRAFVAWWQDRYESELCAEYLAEYFPKWQAEQVAA